MPFTIVVADADLRRRRAVVERISRISEIHECADPRELAEILMRTAPVVVVIGSLGNSPSQTVESACLVRDMHPGAKVIVIADYSSESIAIGALRAGVFEYLKGPVDPMEVVDAVFRATPPADDDCEGFEELVGVSEPIRKIKALIPRIAPLNSTVLITGESGTGKEIVARLVHQHSRRANAPFVCVNCAALPDSLIESELFGHEKGAFTGAVNRQIGQMRNAHNGTLFLDEIGDMSAVAQAKILRALEQREVQPLGSAKPVPVDVRLVAATHRDLDTLVAEGSFRSDLYYRLDVGRIHIPPLRDRPDDIPVLAAHFVRVINRTYDRQIRGLSPSALQTLTRHDWPGNVRQLKNSIEAAAAVCESDWISERDLRTLHSFSVSGPPPVKTAAAAVIPTKQLKLGKDVLLETLEATRWNMTRTAELLQWSRSTLYRNLARYNIQRHGEQETRSASAAPEEESDSPRRRAAAV